MQKFKIACLCLMVLMLSGVGVLAQVNGRQELISVIYQNVRLIIDGRLVSTSVEPFQVEGGHLMVPIRAIGETLGYEMEWDFANKVLYMTKPAAGDETIKTTTTPSYVEELTVLRNVGPFFRLESRNITIARRPFSHGLVVEVVTPTQGQNPKKDEEHPGHYGETVLDLKGQYTWLEGYLGVDDETRNSWGGYKLLIYGDGLILYESQIVKPSEYPFNLRVHIKAVKRLTLQVLWEDAGVGDYDRVWAALANWQVY